jgi:hypothetical protein
MSDDRRDPAAPSAATDRKRREAEALRANLARRKAQQRARRSGAVTPPGGDGGDGGGDGDRDGDRDG